MSRSDFYQSPLLPRIITDNISKLIVYFVIVILLFPMILPEDNYSNFIVSAAIFASHYIPAIAVFSQGSFAPDLSLVDSLISWFLIISASLFVVFMNLSGCNIKTCKNLNQEFPEFISGVSVSQIIYKTIFVLFFSIFFIFPNFPWFPEMPFGFVSGRGMCQHCLLYNNGGPSDRANNIFVQLYYSRFGLGLVYGIISFLSVGFSYLVTNIIRTSACKIIIYLDKH